MYLNISFYPHRHLLYVCISVHQSDMQQYSLKCLCSSLPLIWHHLCATVSPSTGLSNINFTLKTTVWPYWGHIKNLNARRCLLPCIQIVPTNIVIQYKVTHIALMKIPCVLTYISDKLLYTYIRGAVPMFLLNVLLCLSMTRIQKHSLSELSEVSPSEDIHNHFFLKAQDK